MIQPVLRFQLAVILTMMMIPSNENTCSVSLGNIEMDVEHCRYGYKSSSRIFLSITIFISEFLSAFSCHIPNLESSQAKKMYIFNMFSSK